MTTVQIEYFGVQGIGKNVTEAKRDAGQTIERIMRNLSPMIYAYRGMSVVIYPHHGGYSYTLIHTDSDGRIMSCCMCGDDLDDVLGRAIHHLIDCVRKPGEFDLPDWIPSRIVKANASRWEADWKSNDEFQLRYRDSIAKGMSIDDATAYARRDPYRPELWQVAA